MPLDPLGSLSDPTCHGFTLLDEACAKLTRCEMAFRAAFPSETPHSETQKPAPVTGGLSGSKNILGLKERSNQTADQHVPAVDQHEE